MTGAPRSPPHPPPPALLQVQARLAFVQQEEVDTQLLGAWPALLNAWLACAHHAARLRRRLRSNLYVPPALLLASAVTLALAMAVAVAIRTAALPPRQRS